MKPETLERIKFLQNNRTFLGREFLTWLWYWLESRNNVVDVPGERSCYLYINDKIVLSSASGPVREHSMKGGTPAMAMEAKQAVLGGKLVTEANFLMKQDKAQWTWSMKSDDLVLRNVRLPAVAAEEAERYLGARLAHIETLKDLNNHLFQQFCALRFSKGFRTVHNQITTWAADA
jgi:hypothetical protein